MPKTVANAEVQVRLTLREVDMAICGLKIWRQVIAAQASAQFMKGDTEQLSETMVDIDEAISKFDLAKGK